MATATTSTSPRSITGTTTPRKICSAPHTARSD